MHVVPASDPDREKTSASPLEIAMYSLTALAVLAAVAFDIYRRKSAQRA